MHVIISNAFIGQAQDIGSPECDTLSRQISYPQEYGMSRYRMKTRLKIQLHCIICTWVASRAAAAADQYISDYSC